MYRTKIIALYDDDARVAVQDNEGVHILQFTQNVRFN